jgi:hypothetical protein
MKDYIYMNEKRVCNYFAQIDKRGMLNSSKETISNESDETKGKKGEIQLKAKIKGIFGIEGKGEITKENKNKFNSCCEQLYEQKSVNMCNLLEQHFKENIDSFKIGEVCKISNCDIYFIDFQQITYDYRHLFDNLKLFHKMQGKMSINEFKEMAKINNLNVTKQQLISFAKFIEDTYGDNIYMVIVANGKRFVGLLDRSNLMVGNIEFKRIIKEGLRGTVLFKILRKPINDGNNKKYYKPKKDDEGILNDIAQLNDTLNEYNSLMSLVKEGDISILPMAIYV